MHSRVVIVISPFHTVRCFLKISECLLCECKHGPVLILAWKPSRDGDLVAWPGLVPGQNERCVNNQCHKGCVGLMTHIIV